MVERRLSYLHAAHSIVLLRQSSSPYVRLSCGYKSQSELTDEILKMFCELTERLS